MTGKPEAAGTRRKSVSGTRKRSLIPETGEKASLRKPEEKRLCLPEQVVNVMIKTTICPQKGELQAEHKLPDKGIII